VVIGLDQGLMVKTFLCYTLYEESKSKTTYCIKRSETNLSITFFLFFIYNC
jgi:hypothetical protein